ncbi:MAG: SpoIIE family protein phosphatase [Armatimonadetes bacterium]|nr:SpoIIE family protein phosphatase [Armatimonadota bacterium]
MEQTLLQPEIMYRYRDASRAIGDLIATETQTDRAAAGILRIICVFLDWSFSAAWVARGNGDLLERIVSHGDTPPGVGESAAPALERLFEEVCSRKTPIWTPGLPGSRMSGCAFPIIAGNRLLGVMAFWSPRNRPYDPEALSMMSELGSHLSLLIKMNQTESTFQETRKLLADALEHKQKLLDAFMRSFLGTTPQLSGVEIASFYHPADRSDQIGGDYFDFIEISPERIGIAIGDVCGKGLPAGVYTAMAKYMLRTYAMAGEDPASTLTRLNDAICRQMASEGTFLSLFYGILNLAEASFAYANAGHPLPALFTPESESCRRLRVTGGVLGVMEGIAYGGHVVHLSPGSTLALFTDGVIEAAGNLDPFYDGGVSNVLRLHHRFGAKAVTRAIFEHARGQSRGNLRDDIAIVVIRRDPGEPQLFLH